MKQVKGSIVFAFILCLGLFAPASFALEQKPSAGDLAAVNSNSATNSKRIAGPQIAAVPKVTIASIEHISPAAREIADLAGISALLVQLEQSQKNQIPGDLSLNGVAKRQKLIYLREKLNALVQAENVQINCTRGRLDASTAQADELRAFITERRNRMTHKNSQINLLSGGVTKIVGYSIALSPLSDIPTNVLEVFDGTVQTSLSALALRLEKQEAKMEHGLPPILDAFLSGTSALTFFPSSVWRFMNDAVPEAQKPKSRRLQLIEAWEKNGILANARNASQQMKVKRNVTIELLDQRLAMLSDVKSMVSEMHSGLMELSDAIIASYDFDPEW